MAMGLITEYYHFIFTTLVTYLWVLARAGRGSPKTRSALGEGAVVAG